MTEQSRSGRITAYMVPIGDLDASAPSAGVLKRIGEGKPYPLVDLPKEVDLGRLQEIVDQALLKTRENVEERFLEAERLGYGLAVITEEFKTFTAMTTLLARGEIGHFPNRESFEAFKAKGGRG